MPRLCCFSLVVLLVLLVAVASVSAYPGIVAYPDLAACGDFAESYCTSLSARQSDGTGLHCMYNPRCSCAWCWDTGVCVEYNPCTNQTVDTVCTVFTPDDAVDCAQYYDWTLLRQAAQRFFLALGLLLMFCLGPCCTLFTILTSGIIERLQQQQQTGLSCCCRGLGLATTCYLATGTIVFTVLAALPSTTDERRAVLYSIYLMTGLVALWVAVVVPKALFAYSIILSRLVAAVVARQCAVAVLWIGLCLTSTFVLTGGAIVQLVYYVRGETELDTMLGTVASALCWLHAPRLLLYWVNAPTTATTDASGGGSGGGGGGGGGTRDTLWTHLLLWCHVVPTIGHIVLLLLYSEQVWMSHLTSVMVLLQSLSSVVYLVVLQPSCACIIPVMFLAETVFVILAMAMPPLRLEFRLTQAILVYVLMLYGLYHTVQTHHEQLQQWFGLTPFLSFTAIPTSSSAAADAVSIQATTEVTSVAPTTTATTTTATTTTGHTAAAIAYQHVPS